MDITVVGINHEMFVHNVRTKGLKSPDYGQTLSFLILVISLSCVEGSGPISNWFPFSIFVCLE